MNTRFPITVPIYDYNLHSSTNLLPNYFSSVKLFSLPTVGMLYSDFHSPLNLLPEEGLLLTNINLYYQPPQGFYHSSIPYVIYCLIVIIRCTNLTLQLSNPYGSSNRKQLDIFVDWINHSPIVSNSTFSFSATDVHHTVLTIQDEDGDKAFTKILNISNECQIANLPADGILMSSFQYDIFFTGMTNHSFLVESVTCQVLLIVVDSGGLQSNIAQIQYSITNDVIPRTSVIQVWENQPAFIEIELQTLDHRILQPGIQDIQVVQSPTHGIINTTYPFRYQPDQFYFSNPGFNHWGDLIGMENDTLVVQSVYEGLKSSPFLITIIISNINNPPKYK